MAEGGGADLPCHFGRVNWISSKELRRLSSSGSFSPLSPESARPISLEQSVPPLMEDEHWYMKVSCCQLEPLSRGEAYGQGVIVCLGTDAHSQRFADILGISTYPAFALITCHHVLPGLSCLKNWKLAISGMEKNVLVEKTYKLDDRKFEVCKSCCGADGVLGQKDHPNKTCPFGGDFTVLVLTKEFANELLKNRDLLFPTVMPLDVKSLKDALTNQRFSLFKRDKRSGIIRDVKLDVHKRAPPSEDEQTIDGQVTAYKEMCMLRYDKNPQVLRGDSGAGIFVTNGSEHLLLGLHKSTESDEEAHTGIAIHAIFHAIASEAVCMYGVHCLFNIAICTISRSHTSTTCMISCIVVCVLQIGIAFGVY